MLRAFVITLLDFILKIIFFLCVVGGVYVGGYWREFVVQVFPGAPLGAGDPNDPLARESAPIAERTFDAMGAGIGGGVGLIAGVLVCGLAFVLLDIRAQTRRTADLLQKIDDDDHS